MRIWMVGVFSLVLATAGFSQDDWPTHGGGFGNPITYRTKSGKQLIVIATSQSDGTAPKLIAFGLPS